MTSRFKRAERVSSWRRIALHLWDKPRDPTVYGNLEIDMTRALEYLDAANRHSGGVPVTVTHLVTGAIALALAKMPAGNGLVSRRRIYYRDRVDVFCQVATEGGEDLSGVKIEDADHKSPIAIAREMAERVRRVHEHSDPGSERTKNTVARIPDAILGPVLGAIEYLTYDLRLDLSAFGIPFDQFGSAMVSNVGSFGVGHGLAPLVPASRAPIVLLVGRVEQRALVVGGEIVARPAMTIGCTFDHRLIDGFQAGRMASVVKESLHDPFTAFGLPSRSNSTGDRFRMDPAGTKNTSPDGNGYTDPEPKSDPPQDPPRAGARR